jgi:hypothetical protein
MPATKRSPDFDVSHLLSHQQVIARAVLGVLPKDATGGGCRAFYGPKEWAERNETYGLKSLLIVVHDGGDLEPYCNLDFGSYSMHDQMQAALGKVGLYMEQCTSWYSAIYLA